MILPTKPIPWAIKISNLLQEIQKITGESIYPIKVQDIAIDIAKQFFPESPITKISGESFDGASEGMLCRVPNTKDSWGIIYNTNISSSGRINFTLAHELGHYLLQRMSLENGEIKCSRDDMRRWNSEYGQREAEANEFASYLLMPRNLFEDRIGSNEITLHLMKDISNYFNVSITAAILKWLQFTDKRAILVVGKDGFIDWVWHSKAMLKSDIFLRPKVRPIELPKESLAVNTDPCIDALKGIKQASTVWPFDEEVHEMTLKADTYDMTITLLLFSNDKSSKWDEVLEETEPIDIFERITANHN
jgi:hypothetical protein